MSFRGRAGDPRLHARPDQGQSPVPDRLRRDRFGPGRREEEDPVRREPEGGPVPNPADLSATVDQPSERKGDERARQQPRHRDDAHLEVVGPKARGEVPVEGGHRSAADRSDGNGEGERDDRLHLPQRSSGRRGRDVDVGDQEDDDRERTHHDGDDEGEERHQAELERDHTRQDHADHAARARRGVQQPVPGPSLPGAGYVRYVGGVRRSADGQGEFGGDEERSRQDIARDERDGQEERKRQGFAEQQVRPAASRAVGEPSDERPDQARRHVGEGEDRERDGEAGAFEFDQIERQEYDEQTSAIAGQQRVQGEREELAIGHGVFRGKNSLSAVRRRNADFPSEKTRVKGLTERTPLRKRRWRRGTAWAARARRTASSSSSYNTRP